MPGASGQDTLATEFSTLTGAREEMSFRKKKKKKERTWLHSTCLPPGAGKAIYFSSEVYADKLNGMGTVMIHLITCYMHLFYFPLYQAGF